jgi:hypothetical protein
MMLSIKRVYKLQAHWTIADAAPLGLSGSYWGAKGGKEKRKGSRKKEKRNSEFRLIR